MQYYVNIENNSKDIWQLELLIQSFKLKGIQDQLLVSINDTKTPIKHNFIWNTINHKNKIIFNNNGGLENKFLALKQCFNKIQQPFTIIHSDMVLVKPIEELKSNKFLTASFQERGEYKNNIKNIIKNINQKDGISSIKIGNVITINKENKKLIDVLIKYSRILEKFNFGEISCWYLSLLELLNNKEIDLDLIASEQELMNFDLFGNFIHYEHGYPPLFHPLYFSYRNDMVIGEKNPYESITKIPLSDSTKDIIEISRSYQQEFNLV